MVNESAYSSISINIFFSHNSAIAIQMKYACVEEERLNVNAQLT